MRVGRDAKRSNQDRLSNISLFIGGKFYKLTLAVKQLAGAQVWGRALAGLLGNEKFWINL